MTVYFAAQAEADFAEVIRFLTERDPAAASALGQRVFAIIDRLTVGDFDGPEQMLRTGELVRSWPVPPLRVYYQRRDDALWIVRIYHQARRSIVR